MTVSKKLRPAENNIEQFTFEPRAKSGISSRAEVGISSRADVLATSDSR